MKYFLLATFWLFINTDNIAQSYFNKTFDFNDNLENGISIISIDSTYFMAKVYFIPSTGERGIMISHLDSKGNIFKSIEYLNSNTYLSINAIEIINDTIFIAGLKGIGGNSNLLLLKFTQNLDFISSKMIPINIGNIAYNVAGFKLSTDSLLLFFGSIIDTANNNYEGYLVKTDLDGNVVDLNLFGTPANDDIYSFTLDKHENSYATGWTSGYGALYNLIYLVKLDSLGNFIWEKTYGNKNYFNYGASIITLSDGNLLIAGASQDKGYILKADTAGNKIWEKLIGNSEDQWIYKAKEIQNGSIVLMGSQINKNTNNGTEGWLVKTDASGNVIWNKTYNPIGDPDDIVNDYFYDFITTDDGGFLCVGTTAARPGKTQDAWYIKLDSLGNCDTTVCFPWLVGVNEGQKEYNEKINIYPNPTTGIIYLNTTLPKPEKVEIEVFNNLGLSISKKVLGNREIINESIDLQNSPAGLYFIAIKMGNEVKYYKVLKE